MQRKYIRQLLNPRIYSAYPIGVNEAEEDNAPLTPYVKDQSGVFINYQWQYITMFQ